MDRESIFDKLDTCLCGYKMKKGEDFCLQCGKKKFSILKLDNSHGIDTHKQKHLIFSLPDLCKDVMNIFGVK